MTFMEVWIIYSLAGTTLFSMVFIWALRAHQFSNLSDAHNIALDAEPIGIDADNRELSKIDKYTWVALVIITIGALCSVLWLGYRSG